MLQHIITHIADANIKFDNSLHGTEYGAYKISLLRNSTVEFTDSPSHIPQSSYKALCGEF
jgi:hypothetical protein